MKSFKFGMLFIAILVLLDKYLFVNFSATANILDIKLICELLTMICKIIEIYYKQNASNRLNIYLINAEHTVKLLYLRICYKV